MKQIATLRLIDGTKHVIASDNQDLIDHFEDPHNYTREIIAQFEHDYYKDFITPADKVIVDIGANVGLFSLHVSPYAKELYSLEPTPGHFEKLKLNLAHLAEKATCYPVALAGHSGSTKFYWCGVNTTMNSLQPRGGETFTVPCITLADLVNVKIKKPIDLVKIDIEGSEHEAITTEMIQAVAPMVKKFFMEVHPPDGPTVDKFCAMFAQAGYQVQRYVHDSIYAQT